MLRQPRPGNSNSSPAPTKGPTGGVVWHDGQRAVQRDRRGPAASLRPDDPGNREFRRYANRVNGLAHGPERRALRRPGRRPAAGRVHARRTARRRSMRRSTASTTTSPAISWSTAATDSGSPTRAIRRSRSAPRSFLISTTPRCCAWSATTAAHGWLRASPTTPFSPRAVLLSPDEKTLYVADGEPREGQRRELRAYPSVLTAALVTRRGFCPVISMRHEKLAGCPAVT